MDPVSSHSHFDDYYAYQEPLLNSDPLTWGSTYEEPLKNTSSSRADPLEIENLQSIFSMNSSSSAAPTSFQTRELGFDQGLPVNISLEQLTSDFFEESLSNPTPSLSTSINSTPLSDVTPSIPTKQSTVGLNNKYNSETALFPGVLAANPEMSAFDVLKLSSSSLNPMSSSMFINPLQSVEYTSQPLLTHNLSVTSSPYTSARSPDASIPKLATSDSSTTLSSSKHVKPNVLKTKSKSISGPSSSSRKELAAKSKNSLDSRLSLQRLGEVLHTKSQEDTVNIEKFILKVFGKDLGFPLGYKTWIRDTSETYREVLLDELYKRVAPVYPEMTKSLLETVIRRATYSMMQGRLRKERRAASKRADKKAAEDL